MVLIALSSNSGASFASPKMCWALRQTVFHTLWPASRTSPRMALPLSSSISRSHHKGERPDIATLVAVHYEHGTDAGHRTSWNFPKTERLMQYSFLKELQSK